MRSNTAINIPNILTLVRLLCAPLFVILLLQDLRVHALLVFTLAGITDGLDGWIARWLDQRTLLGAYLDPAADKLLLVSAFICLAMAGIIPDWLAVVVLSRDILIVVGIAIFSIAQKKVHMRPSRVSKCTTAAQTMMVIAALAVSIFAEFAWVRIVLIWVTATLTVVSGLHYLYVGMNILQQGEETA